MGSNCCFAIDKVERVLLIKILQEFNGQIDKDILKLIPIDEDIGSEAYLGAIFEYIEAEGVLYFESEFDETTGEFVDYTGMFVFEFTHPVIYNFFRKLEEIKGTQRWDVLVSIFDDKLLNMLRNSFGMSDIFNNFLRDENDIIRGLEFIFSGVDDSVVFVRGLFELVEILEGLLAKMEEGEL